MGSETKTTVERGRWAEERAVAYLERCGYKVVCRNFVCKGGELDLVAEDGTYLCFVEVRFRENAVHGEPLQTVGRVKQARLVRAAQRFLQKHPEIDSERTLMRFDVVSVTGSDPGRVQVVKDAFQAGDVW